jgi:hypothetical protein
MQRFTTIKGVDFTDAADPDCGAKTIAAPNRMEQPIAQAA